MFGWYPQSLMSGTAGGRKLRRSQLTQSHPENVIEIEQVEIEVWSGFGLELKSCCIPLYHIIFLVCSK